MERTTTPLSKGVASGGRIDPSAIWSGREEGKTQARQSIAQYICVSFVPCESGHVKTRRYKQDAKGADFAQGAYLDVSDQAKTQARQCIAQYIRVSPHLNRKTTKILRRG